MKRTGSNASSALTDTLTMTWRCLLLSIRNPDTFFTSLLLPALMMLLFVSLFGNLISVGNTSYVNYIVPGVLLQCIGQCSSTTAIMMARDISGGILNRFYILPIQKASILNGHLLEAFVRNLLTSLIVLLAAAAVGFCPAARFADWCVFLCILSGTILVMSCLALIVGIAANSAEGAGALSSIAIILPYLSSGFVPTETLPAPLALFAAYQPMTPIVDTMRNALLGNGFEMRTFLTALCWCAGLLLFLAVLSAKLFKKKLCQK